jgi:hypothetical protein
MDPDPGYNIPDPQQRTESTNTVPVPVRTPRCSFTKCSKRNQWKNGYLWRKIVITCIQLFIFKIFLHCSGIEMRT